MVEIEPVIIIGAGPAGLATALQLKRFGISPLLLEGDQVGGLLRNANLVENYPGFPGGLPGTELVAMFVEQARVCNVSVTNGEVVKIDFDGEHFLVKTKDWQCKSTVAVIASGTKPITFSEFSIPSQLKDHVYYEIYTLTRSEGKRIVIVGAGDAAFDYALNLCKVNDVLILNRGEEVKCLPLLWDRAKVAKNITYRKQTRIKNVLPGLVKTLSLECENGSGTKVLDADYLVGALGRRPALDFLSDELIGRVDELKESGKLHLVGDVKNDIYRQTTIAVGDGIKTAMKIYRSFKEMDG